MSYYNKNIKEILQEFKTTEEGLSNKEATNRLNKYGKNELPKKESISIIKIFCKELIDPIVLLLLASSVISFIIGEITDGLAILFIIIVDIILGTYQEWKANKTAESLSKLIEVKTTVLRSSEEMEINSTDLVVGDIVLIEPGDKISADLRIINSYNLTADESVLTGESLNVEKNNTKISKEVTISDQKNMLFAGTSIITGRAEAIVVKTGKETEIGQIANKVVNTKETKSPLTIRMEKFSKQITMLIIVAAIIIAVTLYLKGIELSEIFLSVIALSVSAMPEGLPLALTMALTIASNRMSKKNVIVKKLNSVESLGSCTVIASDKTGTLTVNEQTAKKIVLPSNEIFEITGTGYNAKGEAVYLNNCKIENAKFISKLGALNNEAHLEKIKNNYEYFGDSIDIAFLALGMKLKVDTENSNIIDSIPYESENKYSAAIYMEDNKTYCTAKGSFEKIISFCKDMKKNDRYVKLDEELLKNQNKELASDGYRVIAIAQKEIKYTDDTDKEKYLEEMHFIGLIAFIDPIRKEALKAIDECKTAGIKVVMITGDHPLTAFSIAKDLKIVKEYDEVTTGMEVDEYLSKGQEEFDKFIKTKKVFTRVTPLNKLEIIESYKRQGEFVAVTGDGVNDAPALKSANIGVSMGSGTDVAKETSSMIIFDDNFKSIVAGIKEGRNAYSNIRKVSYMLLSCGVAEVLFYLLSIILDLPMPLVAVQLLWLNIVTDGLQDFSLSFEKAEKSIMKEKPRNTNETIFNKELAQEVILSGTVIGLIVFGLWYYLIKILNMDVTISRGYVMMLMVFLQNMHVLNCRSEKESVFNISLKSNPLIIITIVGSILLQIIVGRVPVLSKLLQTQSVPFLDMIFLLVLSTTIIVIMEFYKILKIKKSS